MGNSGDVSQVVVVGVCRILALCYETYKPDILEKDQVLEALNKKVECNIVNDVIPRSVNFKSRILRQKNISLIALFFFVDVMWGSIDMISRK